ncbi:MAG: hypothetical protein A2X85_17415 [Geobacteraceae bacterium GWF2_54_21]|nr:MAG: hypothetical protein A2X85_17415 [Geobacteraceae bacterium GWF2_54_21]
MDLIHQNPFRILGLPINASEKDIAKRVSELEAYASIGKEISYETDYPCLSPLERTAETIREAANRIETADGRLFYTFFWFWQYNSADELALDVLRDGNIDKSIKLLENQLKDDKLTPQSYSTAKNLICLYIASLRNGGFNQNHLSKSILLAGRFFEDELLQGYITWLSGPHFSFDHQKTISAFVDEVIRCSTPHIGKQEGISIPQFVEMFSSFSADVQRSIASRFSSKHILNIEKAIKASENARKQSPERANTIGEHLYVGTIHEIEQLLEILSDQDLKYQTTADNLADELLGCSIAYFNYHLDLNHGEDPGENALKLIRFAESIAFGKKVQLRIQKNRSTMEDHVSTWAANRKWMSIKADYDAIKKRINAVPELENLSDIEVRSLKVGVECFLADSIQNLSNIRKIAGSDNGDYLSASSAIVSQALDMCIEYANRVKQSEDIMNIMMGLAEFDMDSKTRERYQSNRTILLKNLTVTVDRAQPSSASRPSSSSYQAPRYQTNPAPSQSYLKNFFGKWEGFGSFLKNWDGFSGLFKFCTLFLFVVWLFSVVFDANKSQSYSKPSTASTEPVTTPERYKLESPSPTEPPPKSSSTDTSKNLSVAPNGRPWPQTSAYIQGYAKKRTGGLSTVLIDNSQNSSPVFVTLNYLEGQQPNPVRLIHIKAYSKFKMTGIISGSYDVRYKDLESGSISKSESFDLNEFKTETGTQFSNITMTLYTVQNGNMHTSAINEAEFM